MVGMGAWDSSVKIWLKNIYLPRLIRWVIWRFSCVVSGHYGYWSRWHVIGASSIENANILFCFPTLSFFLQSFTSGYPSSFTFDPPYMSITRPSTYDDRYEETSRRSWIWKTKDCKQERWSGFYVLDVLEREGNAYWCAWEMAQKRKERPRKQKLEWRGRREKLIPKRHQAHRIFSIRFVWNCCNASWATIQKGWILLAR